jgi:hypothetical protein
MLDSNAPPEEVEFQRGDEENRQVETAFRRLAAR